MSLCGAVAALGGMSVYTSLSINETKETPAKQNPSQNQPTKPKTDVEDDEEKADVKSVKSVSSTD